MTAFCSHLQFLQRLRALFLPVTPCPNSSNSLKRTRGRSPSRRWCSSSFFSAGSTAAFATTSSRAPSSKTWPQTTSRTFTKCSRNSATSRESHATRCPQSVGATKTTAAANLTHNSDNATAPTDGTALIALARTAAAQHSLDPALVCAIVEQESAWDPHAIRYEPAFRTRYVAPLGLAPTEEVARSMSWGLMQVMGQVAREHGFTAKSL